MVEKLKLIGKYQKEIFSFNFQITFFSKNDGLLVEITGPGDHLGGIGLGTPYIRPNGLESANSQIFSFPGHRDGELAGSISRIISKITRKKVITILGIHIDDLESTQLQELIESLNNWIKEISYDLINSNIIEK